MRTFTPTKVIFQIYNQLIGLGLLCCLISVSSCASAQIARPIETNPSQTQTQDRFFSMEELIDLVGPIALFPDDLLALTLEAASHPIAIVSANRMKKKPKKAQKINSEWDESVVALLNYPEILEMLDQDIEWTQKLGKAKTHQPAVIMQAIEQFRNEAHQSGNLKSDSYQVVSVDDDRVIIRHKNKDKIYIPYYDPEKVRLRQTRTVYHYYPNAYPVYYYPYQSSFYFDEPFFGIDSVFGLSWNRYHLNRYSHSHFLHPYYGTAYNPRHFGRTRAHTLPLRNERKRISNRSNQNERSSPSISQDSGLPDGPEQTWMNRKQQNRNRNIDLESSHIKTSNTSFRVVERDRHHRHETTRAESFSNLGNQQIMRYPAQNEIKSGTNTQNRSDRR